jgi:hypothetical protein
MFDPDTALILFLVIMVIALLAGPRGPGTPLQSPVQM